MKFKIGFILSEPIKIFMEEIESELTPYCDIIYIPIIDVSETVNLFRKHEDLVDAFVFSGKALYYSVITKIEEPSKPCFTWDVNEMNIKEIFLKLLLENRQFDFSRVFIDIAFEMNNYLGIKELLKDGSMPYFNDLDLTDIDEYTYTILNRHIELYESGKIDFSITQLGLFLNVFEEKGIPYAYAYPDQGYIISFFMKIINKLSEEKVKERKLGAIILRVEGLVKYQTENSKGHLMMQYAEAIQAYARIQGYDFTVHLKEDELEILTQYKDLVLLTNNFTDIGIKDYLQTPIDSKIFVGLGTGNNIYKARQNAQKAIQLSQLKDAQIYYVSYNDIITGPIGENASQTYLAMPSDKLITLAEKLHIDHVNLQKIKAFIEVNNSPKVTADKLAEYLGVTVRTASRLLNKIEQHHGVVSYFENIKGGRGRPKKFYDLTFIDVL